MKRLRIALPMLATVLLLSLVGTIPVATPAHAASKAAPLAVLKAQALYFLQVGKTPQRQVAVGSIAARSAWEGKLWTDFLATWETINASMKMNSSTPKGLPKKGHVFVVLGSGLTSAGKITTTLERRMKVALKALDAYPNSKVLVTGGAPKKGNTEAKVMRDWLVNKGIAASRILSEDKSSSTIGNAKNSMAILAKSSKYTSYTLITDSGHMRRASILFHAATLLVQERSGTAWSIKPVANAAVMDMPEAGKVPLSASSVAYTASNVASLLGVLDEYKKVVAKPPARAVLTSLKVTAPAKVKYQVGAKLNTKGLAAKATYDKGVYTRFVTSGLKLTGFSSKKVGGGKVTVTYTEGKVTKTSTFSYSIVKATSKIGVSLSTKKVKRAKTKVVVKAKITSTASSVVPTGTVKFYLDGKLLKAVSLKAGHKGVVKLTYPKIAKAGKHKIVVKYSGTSKLTSARKALSLTVKK